MSSDHSVQRPVYLVGERVLSIQDLLQRFADPRYLVDGISRLSDLHLKIGDPARYRFDGELVPLPEAAPISSEVLEGLLLPLLTDEQIAHLKRGEPGDVDAGYECPETGINFRINAFRDREGLACALRMLPREIPPTDEIGFPTDAVWKEITAMSQGLVIVTGITGSGKSTTIASLLQHINATRRTRIITLEDPIEYVLPSKESLISQRELGRHVPSFHEGLRSALREDPDVIFVGEMRDRETTSLALTAGETGHLVLSTLHTKDTKGAVTRIVDMFPPERTKELATQLSFSLSMVIGQKLVPRARGGGRRVAMEILKILPAVAHHIRAGNWHHIYSTMETHAKHGLLTLEKHLVELVEKGEITRDAALHAANTGAVLSRLGGE